MKRQQPTIKILKALFAKSGNRCAFPGCQHQLVDENNLFIGQLCHIEALSKGGPRFNLKKSITCINDYDNLVLMCYAHHKRIDDDPTTYTAESIRKMKDEHEAKFLGKEFEVSDETVKKIIEEINEYWSGIKKVQLTEHPYPDFAIPFNEKADFNTTLRNLNKILKSLRRLCEIFDESDERLDEDCRALLKKLKYDISAYEALPYYENPFVNRNWEYRALGIHNHFARIQILIKQLELKYMEERLKSELGNEELSNRYNKLKTEFEKLIVKSMLND